MEFLAFVADGLLGSAVKLPDFVDKICKIP
jgi:hypothetical protein